PRSREYQPFFALPRETSGWFGLIAPVCDCCAKPMYAVVTKSTRPLIVTLGAGVWAELGATVAPRMTRSATTTTTDDLMNMPPRWLSWAEPRHVEDPAWPGRSAALPRRLPAPAPHPAHVATLAAGQDTYQTRACADPRSCW